MAPPAVWISADSFIVHRRTQNYELNFIRVKYQLDIEAFDDVYLIDTCYAATAAHMNPEALLAARDVPSETVRVGVKLFTACLISHLQEAAHSKDWLSFASLPALMVQDVQRNKYGRRSVYTEPYPGVSRKLSIIFLPRPGAHYTLKALGSHHMTMANVFRNRQHYPTAKMIAHIRKTKQEDVLGTLRKTLESNPDGPRVLLVNHVQYEPSGSGILAFNVDVALPR